MTQPEASRPEDAQVVRVLIVDDHEVVRQGLRMFLALDPGLKIVGEAADGQQALLRVAELRPDVVVMDLMMPVMGGVAATREIRRLHPETEVLALTSALEERQVSGAIDAGATGYLLKDASVDTLTEAIHAAARGEVRLHPEAARRLVREFRTPDMRESLTPSETLILKLIARGWANRTIAAELRVSEPTVKTHVSRLLGKLALSSRTQAALYALKYGLASLESSPLDPET